MRIGLIGLDSATGRSERNSRVSARCASARVVSARVSVVRACLRAGLSISAVSGSVSAP